MNSFDNSTMDHLRMNEQLLISMTLTFLSLSVITLLFILVSRSIKNIRSKNEQLLQTLFQQTFNRVIITEPSAPKASYQFYLHTLTKIIRRNKHAHRIIIDQLISIKKNITGS